MARFRRAVCLRCVKLLRSVLLTAGISPTVRATTPKENSLILSLTLPSLRTGDLPFLAGHTRVPAGKDAPVKVELVAEIEMER
jgi:hypothetical protein